MATTPARRSRGEPRMAAGHDRRGPKALPRPATQRASRASAPAERVARVVELFVLNPGQRFSLSQIVEELNLSISTVHSILTTLVGRRTSTVPARLRRYTRTRLRGRAAR